MPTCPDVLKRLIDRFHQQADQIRSPDDNETLIRIEFINPLMRELVGTWTTARASPSSTARSCTRIA